MKTVKAVQFFEIVEIEKERKAAAVPKFALHRARGVPERLKGKRRLIDFFYGDISELQVRLERFDRLQR